MTDLEHTLSIGLQKDFIKLATEQGFNGPDCINAAGNLYFRGAYMAVAARGDFTRQKFLSEIKGHAKAYLDAVEQQARTIVMDAEPATAEEVPKDKEVIFPD